MSDYSIADYQAALREAWTAAVVICNHGYPMDDDEKERLVSMNIEHSLKVAHGRNLAAAVVGFVATNGPAIGGSR